MKTVFATKLRTRDLMGGQSGAKPRLRLLLALRRSTLTLQNPNPTAQKVFCTVHHTVSHQVWQEFFTALGRTPHSCSCCLAFLCDAWSDVTQD